MWESGLYRSCPWCKFFWKLFHCQCLPCANQQNMWPMQKLQPWSRWPIDTWRYNEDGLPCCPPILPTLETKLSSSQATEGYPMDPHNRLPSVRLLRRQLQGTRWEVVWVACPLMRPFAQSKLWPDSSYLTLLQQCFLIYYLSFRRYTLLSKLYYQNQEHYYPVKANNANFSFNLLL